MKQPVIDWYCRNKFLFWQIENSKGKLVAANTAGKAGKAPDEGGVLLTIELDSLERLNISERYSVSGMEKNGDGWQSYPFVTYATVNPVNSTGGNYPIEMALMLGRIQAEQSSNQVIWQLQQEKIDRERKEQEKSAIADTLRQVAPALLSSAAPVIFKSVFDLAGKSPQIMSLLEKVCANPLVQDGITQMVTNYFTTNQNGSTSTGIDTVND